MAATKAAAATTNDDKVVEAPENNTPDTAENTASIDVTLSNGAQLTLDVIKDQGDWAYEAVEAMSEMNYPVLVNAILTKKSKFLLRASGARVRDFEMITDKVSEAIGSIRADKNEDEE